MTKFLFNMVLMELEDAVGKENADATFDHIRRSPSCSMEKAERLLGFVPRHSVIDTAESAVRLMIAKGKL